MSDVKMFEVGKTYRMSSVGDHNCVWRYKIAKRTIQTVILEGLDGAEGSGRKRIGLFHGVETVSPLGRYSMAPILSADKVDEDRGEEEDIIVAALKDGIRREFARLKATITPKDIQE